MALLVYVDESGQPYQIDEGPYVVVSVAIDEGELDKLNRAVKDLIMDINNRFGLRINEIHTKQLVKGNGPWNNVPMRKRAKIFQDIAEIIADLDIVLNIVAAVKSRPGIRITSFEGIRRHVLKLLAERLFMIYSQQKVTIIIFDSSTIGNDVKIKEDMERGIREGLISPTYRTYVSFSYSDREPGIQIADYVAYLTRHIITKQYKWQDFDFEKAFLTIEPKIRRCHGGNIYINCGLKIWEIE